MRLSFNSYITIFKLRHWNIGVSDFDIWRLTVQILQIDDLNWKIQNMSVHGRSNTKTLHDFEHKQEMTVKIDNK